MPTIAADNGKTTSEIEHVDWSTGGGSSGQHNYTSVRYGSGSSQASQSSGDICRICHCESDPQNPLLTPCYCAGSLKYVHQTCLQQWLTASETNACELCKFPFIMHTKIKPFNEWRSLDITGIERRRLCCSLLFHCAAALCVIWSLCVLIERAADDVQRGLIDWPFWTKLAVVMVGMTGGIVFMYIQCKAYLHLCHRWKARNRILLIQNAPEKIHLPSPVVQHRNRRCCSAGASDDMSSCTQRDRGSINAGAASIDLVDNSGTSLSNYGGYARNSVSIDVMGAENDEAHAAGSSIHHHHQLHNQHRHHSLHKSHQNHHMASTPGHLLPNDDLDVDSLVTQASSSSVLGMHSNMFQQDGLQHRQLMLLDGGGAIAATGGDCDGDIAGVVGQPPPLGQVAVSANIECSQSQHNYERDWALDDVVSQISSFRPCPQGSGSMTPFHDSIHNVLEHSEDCSSRDLSTGGVSSEMGRDHAMQLSSFSGSGENKAPSIGSGASNAVANGLGGFVYKPHNKRYSNSSIFLENRDILSDNDGTALSLDMNTNDYIKGSGSFLHHHHHRHHRQSSSNALSNSGSGGDIGSGGSGTDNTDNDQYVDSFLNSSNKQKRRYSDPKFQTSNNDEKDPNSDAEANVPMLLQHETQTKTTLPHHIMLDLELPKSPLSGGRMQHHLQQSNSQQQPTSKLQLMHRSLHTVDMGEELMSKQNSSSSSSSSNRHVTATKQQSSDVARVVFKSLPNLSSSCESLIKK